ncbi:MAG: hypothetical protein KKG92_05030 [Gammaproteobacteria bacterium]|nr:hypothetical protein [Gammaproteobacteria bacterium]
MAVVRVVEKLSVPTHLGVLRFERYADGDIIASLGGNHWFGIDGDDQGRIARFLGGGTAVERPNSAISVTAPKRYCFACREIDGDDGNDQEVITRFLGRSTAVAGPNGAVKPQIRKEARGWGVNVTASERYYYASRDDARQAKPVHRVGECARVG